MLPDQLHGWQVQSGISPWQTREHSNSLLHFATGEEMVTDAEWKYFLDCLNGNRVYNLEEKLQMTDKNSIDGSV